MNIAEEAGIWVSALPLLERQFAKKICFEKMGLFDTAYADTPQIQGGFIAFKKTDFAVSFVTEWLKYCCDFRLISPAELGEEDSQFYSHREDQSILSLLVKKYSVRAYSDHTQYGRLPENIFETAVR